jgi:hypothetical protein
MSYRPLPKFLYLSSSDIDGMGLFTSKTLEPELVLGVTHVADSRFEDGYIRTPLGGFFNHSNEPNCEACVSEDMIYLKTLKHIVSGSELTAFYWLYSLE